MRGGAVRQDDFNALVGKADDQFEFSAERGEVAAQGAQLHVGLAFELGHLRLGNTQPAGQRRLRQAEPATQSAQAGGQGRLSAACPG
nr:hypothetical protein [uncultured Dechloromonas sp.]